MQGLRLHNDQIPGLFKDNAADVTDGVKGFFYGNLSTINLTTFKNLHNKMDNI
jgi:hypothetical protein